MGVAFDGASFASCVKRDPVIVFWDDCMILCSMYWGPCLLYMFLFVVVHDWDLQSDLVELSCNLTILNCK